MGKALEGIAHVVKEVCAEMEASGEAVPLPLSDRHYSGKFQVRIPPQRHRQLAMEAVEAGSA